MLFWFVYFVMVNGHGDALCYFFLVRVSCSQMVITEAKAERCLREADGDVMTALRRLVDSSSPDLMPANQKVVLRKCNFD